VDFCVVVVSGVVLPSGFTVAGDVCLVSLFTVVFSVVCGVGEVPGTTTVEGGAGDCWQPAKIPPRAKAIAGRHLFNEYTVVSFLDYC
jgi:hypothetical protein